jgi:cytoskeletal protein CcmA (bactofilin family)
VESLIRLEGIPYAVAGSETVTLRNVNVSDPDPGDVAHVYSGRTGADSLNISGLLSVITGDARSAGAINVGGGAIVQGDVEPNISPETLPILNIAGFGNSGWPGQPTGFQPVGIFGSGGHTVPGSVQYGTLTLNDTILFVEGDLDVGLLLGTGTIFVTGETTFLANVNMTGPDRITIFQGVVYSRGDIRAAGVFQVLGAVYAVSTPAGGGNIELGGLLLPLSNVIYNAESTAFASFWLAQGGEAEAVRVYWRRLR